LIVVGVAGPAGSGKSAVCRMLARRQGIAHVNCDELAWRTYRPGGPAYVQLLARFGEEILDPNGAVDRARLAELCLRDPDAKGDLEAIVHPHVMKAVRRAIEHHAQAGARLALVEGALLLSSPHVDRAMFDLFVWLHAPEDVRRRRLLDAGVPWEQVEARFHAQRDLSPPLAGNVYAVETCGTPAHAAQRVLSIVREAVGADSAP